MKCVNGIYLPDSDTHFGPMMEKGPLFEGKGTYQIRKLDQAMPYVRQFRTAVDVGAHVGLWSRVLAAKFDRVVAFEPVAEHYRCFKANMAGIENVVLHGFALVHDEPPEGFDGVTVQMNAAGPNSGNARIDFDGGSMKVPARTLDSFGLKDIDFLKIDVEGYELGVIAGAESTININRPVIVVEQKPGNAQRYGFGEIDAVKLLQKWGYNIAWNIGGDYCLTSGSA